MKSIIKFTMKSHCLHIIFTLTLVAGAANHLFAQSHKPQIGLCTYYSDKAHGHLMSSGERYDKDGFTCAHRTLPFGTRVKVTNLTNGKTTIVKVADRGPFGPKLVIDVSGAAARELAMIRTGVVKVKLDVLPSEHEILEELEHYPMSDEPEYMKQFELDPPDVRQQLDWPDMTMPPHPTPQHGVPHKTDKGVSHHSK